MESIQSQLRRALKETYFQAWDPQYVNSAAFEGDLEQHVTLRFETCARRVVPWVERQMPLAGRTLVEIGCGTGSSTAAFAQAGARVEGYDIEAASVEAARRRCEILGLAKDVALHCVSPEALIPTLHQRHAAVDAVLLYAVLEHQTIPERLDTLRSCWDLLRPGGLLIVFETPNRLVYSDDHTSNLPFFNMLPDELALRYAQHSPRAEFRSGIAQVLKDPVEVGLERLARWGRGVSYHEFELVLGDLRPLVVSDGFAPEILEHFPREPTEELLRAFFEREALPVPIGFSRRWIDVILKKPDGRPPEDRQRHLPPPLTTAAPATSVPASGAQELQRWVESTTHLGVRALKGVQRRARSLLNR